MDEVEDPKKDDFEKILMDALLPRSKKEDDDHPCLTSSIVEGSSSSDDQMKKSMESRS